MVSLNGGYPKMVGENVRANPNLNWMIFLGVARDDETDTSIFIPSPHTENTLQNPQLNHPFPGHRYTANRGSGTFASERGDAFRIWAPGLAPGFFHRKNDGKSWCFMGKSTFPWPFSMSQTLNVYLKKVYPLGLSKGNLKIFDGCPHFQLHDLLVILLGVGWKDWYKMV